ncbi:protein CD300H-like isoform X2 [Ornithorhynchus anatinus]|uniref:protein CD300H-like isoform X2 n=1 Tax=Ornithorhynchus anatinus TaxID=9258 RepID=UPI0010A804AC|nr:protein CD300H-like isoform X2 [Ornithorhynchus anatinus]
MPLPWALLLLFLPGCVLARNFTEVKGIVGEPLSVQCPYKEEYKMYGKYWCRGNFWVSCSIIIKTESKEGEVKSGRVAISDSHRNLTFTVTMENLTADDAGSYACGINKGLIISWFRVSISQEAAVKRSKPTTSTAEITNATQDLLDMSLPKDKDSPRRLSLSSSFIALIFLTSLKLPIFLSLVLAAIWMKRLQRRQKAWHLSCLCFSSRCPSTEPEGLEAR